MRSLPRLGGSNGTFPPTTLSCKHAIDNKFRTFCVSFFESIYLCLVWSVKTRDNLPAALEFVFMCNRGTCLTPSGCLDNHLHKMVQKNSYALVARTSGKPSGRPSGVQLWKTLRGWSFYSKIFLFVRPQVR